MASKTDRRSLYQEVTNQIISELEQGRVPWVQPWGTPDAKASLGLPRNAKTDRSYSGVNILILWGAVIQKGYSCQQWLTFRQARNFGSSVRKGERGTVACYADRFIPRAERERAARDGDEPEAVPFLKRFVLFNVKQCEGLPERVYQDKAPLPEREIVPQAEALITATGADLRIGGTRACYVPSGDFIQMPPQQAFFDQVNFFAVCLHELTHWAGAASRLNRDLSGSFGSQKYAREELVAELGAAFTCAELGIEPTLRHSDYLGSWLDLLRGDDRAIFRAASQASKAANYLLGFRADAEQVEAAA